MTESEHSPMSDQPMLRVERVQTGVRIEKRMLKVLGDLLEGIVLHAFEGTSPFNEEAQQRIATLKEIYGMEYDASYSHRLFEDSL
jgi:hypothetical protein